MKNKFTKMLDVLYNIIYDCVDYTKYIFNDSLQTMIQVMKMKGFLLRKKEVIKMKENKYTQIIPKCFNCDHEMILDDIDFKFEGNQDNYFICTKCNSEIIQNVRFGKINRNIYIDEEGKIINIEKVR